MPAQWTGEVVGKIHNNRLTAKELAEELGWNDKYLSQVLNSENPPKNAEQKVFSLPKKCPKGHCTLNIKGMVHN